MEMSSIFARISIFLVVVARYSNGISNFSITSTSTRNPLLDLPAAIIFDHGSIDTSGLDKIPLLFDTEAFTPPPYTPLTGRDGAGVGEPGANPYVGISTDPGLSSQCSLQWSSAFSKYIATGLITTEVFTVLNTTTSYKLYENIYRFSATSPCCLACQLEANNAQVLFWPTPAPTPGVSALVDPTGFTYVSPSVYVVFDQLAATNLCGQAGQSFQNKTLSFAPAELSTTQFLIGPRGYQLLFPQYDWTTFNFADLTNSNCTDEPAAPRPGPLSTISLTHNPCFPLLSVPSKVYALDGAWSTCLNELNVAYDPPRTLTPGLSLTAVDPSTTPVVEAPQTSNNAQAGPVVAPQTPVPTPVIIADPPKPNLDPPASPGPPAKSDPPASPDPPAKPDPPASPDPPTPVDPPPVHNDPVLPAKPADLGPVPAPTFLAPNPDPGSGAQTVVRAGGADPATQLPAPPSKNDNIIAPPPLVIGSQTLSLGSTISIAGTPVVGAPGGKLIIASKTLSPGSTIHLAGTPIALEAKGGNLVIGAQTLSPGSTISIAGTPVVGAPDGKLIIASQTLSPGSTISIAGTPVVGAQDGKLIIASQTLAPGSTIHLGGTPIALEAKGGNLVIGAQTLSPGSTAFIAGTPVALGAQTGGPAGIQTLSPGSTISVAGTPIAIGLQGNLVIGTQTLSPGSTITVAGTPVANGGQSGNLVIGAQTLSPGSTAFIAGIPIALGLPTLTPGSTISVAGTPIALGPQGDLVIGTQTLPPGSTITIAGTPVARGAQGGIIVAGQTFPPGSTATIGGTPIALGSEAAPIIIGSQTLNPGSTIFISGTPLALGAQNHALVIGTRTLLPGSTITVAGTPIALDPQNTNILIVGTSSETIGLASLIMNGFQPNPTPTPTVIAGISLSLSPSEAIISGSTYLLNTPTTLTIGTATLALGPAGVTPAPPPSISVATIGTLLVTFDPSEAVVGGSTYKVGKGAGKTTVVVGGETLTFGSAGVGFGGGTVTPPPPVGTQGGNGNGVVGFEGAAARRGVLRGWGGVVGVVLGVIVGWGLWM